MNPAESYILDQSEPFRSILLHLQVVIETTVPDAVLQYKWKVPYYCVDGKLPFCYLNCTNGYVDLVFWHGAHLTKHLEVLVSKGRKHFKSLRYRKPEDIDQEVLLDLIKEAYSLRDKKYYK